MLKISSINPVNKNLVVKMINTKQEKSPGGIVLVGSPLQESVKRAEVISVDPDIADKVAVGNQVLFQDNYSNALTFMLDPADPESKLTVLPFNMILMVVK
jgi:co-chaperonin GroES (HSP10)